MIREYLEGGGGITQAKGHDQELIVTLMISKGLRGDVIFLHTYLVVARTHIKFSEVSSTTQLIQEIINNKKGTLFLDGEFIEGTKVRTHAQGTFFLEYYDHMRRIGLVSREDINRLGNLLHDFLLCMRLFLTRVAFLSSYLFPN